MKKSLAVAALAATLSGAAIAQPPVALRIGHFLPPQSLTHSKLFVPLAEGLTKDSGGMLKATVYPGGSLGRSPAQQLQLVLDGVIDVSFIVQSYTPGEFPDNSLMELPLLMQATREACLVHERLYQRGLLRGYDKVKVIGLGTTSAYTLHLNFPYKTLDDLKGRKLRAATGVQSQIIDALGGTPVGGIAVTQTAESLSRGLIDGTLLGWESMITFRVIPVTTHHVQFPLGFTPLMVAMNRAKYEGLPAALKKVVDKYSGDWVAEHLAKNYNAMGGRALAAAEKTGTNVVVELSAPERKRWEAALRPIVEDWKAKHDNGPKLLAALEEEVKKIRDGR
jgi:TRAP-type C4-dicarboxylate transport system substrate-binding protein